MSVSIKDVVINMNEAQKRTLEDDKKKLQELATVYLAANNALNDYATCAADSFKEFGLTKSGLIKYAKAMVNKGGVSEEVHKLENAAEELEFLQGESDD